MRTVGDIDLLMEGIYYDKINLLSRWHSKQMMTYFHTSACPLLQKFNSAWSFAGNTPK